MSNFINNRIENATGFDMNGDGYVGGQGLESKVERATHVDFNGDGIIGRFPDTFPGGGGYGASGFGGPGFGGSGGYQY